MLQTVLAILAAIKVQNYQHKIEKLLQVSEEKIID